MSRGKVGGGEGVGFVGGERSGEQINSILIEELNRESTEERRNREVNRMHRRRRGGRCGAQRSVDALKRRETIGRGSGGRRDGNRICRLSSACHR